MPDYIYLLENRLSADQRHALHQLREAAREAGLILFLTGDAVRDLTSGHAVRDIEVAVHGNALKLKKGLENLGAKIWGEDGTAQSLYLCFPGTVRIDLVSTHRIEYPKPGKPVYHPASIQEDLRRRDFAANAMAISLNEGSYGLLMDPLNGAADIEGRILRLVSNYGFLEEPAFLIRATRLRARLGWELDPRTQSRYENAKEERVIQYLSPQAVSQELEQIGHESDGLKVLAALEAEGWMEVLFPTWTVARADQEKLKALHDLSAELQIQGVHPDMSAAQMELLTAKLPPKELAALKKQLLRPGFVEEWDSLDSIANGFSKVLLSKQNQAPSATFNLFTSYDPEAVLWLGFTSNAAAVKERYEQFLKVWPEARQRIPYALLLEMRITPELANYNEILQKIFLELIDGRLTTTEDMRAFLEPYSPPAPPPQITIKRSRAKRGSESKVRERSFDDEEEEEEGSEDDSDLDDIGGDEEEEADLGLKSEIESDRGDDEEAEGEEVEDDPGDEEEPAPKRSKKAPVVAAAKPVVKPAPAKAVPEVQKPAPAAKPEPAPTTKPELKSEVKPANAKPAPAAKPAAAHPAATTKPEPPVAHKNAAHTAAPIKAAKPAPKPEPKKVPAKLPVKAPVKGPVKAQVSAKGKPVTKPAPAKHAPEKKPAAKPAKPSKPAPRKAPPKPAKKR
jgi:tRNA nucleotidyltransferase/poly(A) polymerase